MSKEKKPNEGVEILTVNGYMKRYAIDGIGKGADRNEIREQLLDAFRKEIFDTAVMMVGPQLFYDNYEATEKERNKLDNIMKNCNNKWKSLCKEFAKYQETCNLIYDDDLMKYMQDRDAALKKAESAEYYEDIDVEEADEETEEIDEKPGIPGEVIVERDENGKPIAGRYPMGTDEETSEENGQQLTTDEDVKEESADE